MPYFPTEMLPLPVPAIPTGALHRLLQLAGFNHCHCLHSAVTVSLCRSLQRFVHKRESWLRAYQLNVRSDFVLLRVDRVPCSSGPVSRISPHRQGSHAALRPRRPTSQCVCWERVVPLPKQLPSASQVSSH